MAQRIETDTPLPLRSQVTKMARGITMRCLMQRNREYHRQGVDRDRLYEIEFHVTWMGAKMRKNRACRRQARSKERTRKHLRQ